ncbi:hypothetical protein T069G_04065 [Trichoderma breve]|uniref:MACPF domain-containing protein n=1 Tax=Trichoderma breve TaxID=2034170 RepID=A0A9W9EAH5_9HYPO|nr:hypothetical protein T069G_04065 [Trichoderma breve]KAJ4863111.1 hypothetical protein T069G_04065 [Trichoderma breve]
MAGKKSKNKSRKQKQEKNRAAQQEPATSRDGQQEPDNSLVEQQEPVPTSTEQQEPDTNIVGQQEPNLGAVGQQMPTTGIVGQEEPDTSIVEPQAPNTGIIGQQVPDTSMGGQQIPAVGIVGQQEPVTSTTKQPELERGTVEQQQPNTGVVEQQRPDESITEQQRLDTTTAVQQKPDQNILEQREPVPITAEQQESAKAIAGQQKPLTGSSYSDERDHLSSDDWQGILQRTGALNGWVPQKKNGDIDITRAAEQLFTLKPEAMPKWNTATGSPREAVQFQDSTEESFVKAAFDTSAIKATIQATTPTGKTGVRGSFARSTGDKVSHEHSGDVKSFYLFHEFPLAVVDLEGSSLVPTQNFVDFIKDSINEYAGLIPPTTSADREAFSSVLNSFHDRFGTVFTKRVALGGRRYAIQKVYRHSQAVNQSSEEKSAIKASLDAPLTIGSLKAAGERSWGSTSGDGDYGNVTIDVNSLVIDGGDETLTEDVETWQNTLLAPKNWKVIKQNNVEALFPFLLGVLDRMEPKYEYIDFVRGLAIHDQDLRKAHERRLTAVSEPLTLRISSSYAPTKSILSSLTGKKPKWTMTLNTDKPKMIDRVKVKIPGYFENGKDRVDDVVGFPKAFPVSIDLPTQWSLTPKKTTKKYEAEFTVILKPSYEWQESDGGASTVTLKDISANTLVFGALLSPESATFTAEYSVRSTK